MTLNKWLSFVLIGLTVGGCRILNEKLASKDTVEGCLWVMFCMSLDERLASKNDGVRLEAEQELIQQAYEKGTSQDRLSAISRVTDQKLLFDVAMNEKSSQEERLAAVSRITDQNLLFDVAMNEKRSQEEHLAAIDRLTDKTSLFKVAMKARENTAKEGEAAVLKLSDANQFLQVARESPVKEVGLAAVSKITDANQFLQVANRSPVQEVGLAAFSKIKSTSDYEYLARHAVLAPVRVRAYYKIVDQAKLLSIVQETNDRSIKLLAIKKVDDKEKLLPIIFASTDVKLVNDFIKQCTDEAVLIKMVKQYADKLTADQCSKLTAKAKSAELKDLIASVADLKIAEQIRVAKPTAYKTLLDSITNPKIKNDACMGMILLYLEIGNYRYWSGNERTEDKYGEERHEFRFNLQKEGMREYIGYLTDKQITDFVIYSKVNDKDIKNLDDLVAGRYIKDLAEHHKKIDDSIVNEMRSAMIDAIRVKSPECFVALFCDYVEAKKKDPDSVKDFTKIYCDSFTIPLLRMFDSDSEKITQEMMIKIINATSGFVAADALIEFLSKKVTTPEAVEAFLASDYISAKRPHIWKNYSYGTGKWITSDTLNNTFDDSVLRCMANVMLKVSADEKKRVLEEAKKHLAENKDAVKIGPFYCGMSYYEAMIVAENEGLIRKGVNLIWFTFYNYKPEEIVKDVKNNLKVSSITFKPNASLKYLDCEEDALIQNQAIKQCVKQEPGKAKALDYLGEIKHDFGEDEDSSILWANYTNTRLGVKLSFDSKSGELILTRP